MGSLAGIESVTRFSKYDFTVFLDELASFDRQSDKELLLKRWTTVVMALETILGGRPWLDY